MQFALRRYDFSTQRDRRAAYPLTEIEAREQCCTARSLLVERAAILEGRCVSHVMGVLQCITRALPVLRNASGCVASKK